MKNLTGRLKSGALLVSEVVRLPAEILFQALKMNMELIGTYGTYCSSPDPMAHKAAERIDRNYNIFRYGD